MDVGDEICIIVLCIHVLKAAQTHPIHWNMGSQYNEEKL